MEKTNTKSFNAIVNGKPCLVIPYEDATLCTVVTYEYFNKKENKTKTITKRADPTKVLMPVITFKDGNCKVLIKNENYKEITRKIGNSTITSWVTLPDEKPIRTDNIVTKLCIKVYDSNGKMSYIPYDTKGEITKGFSYKRNDKTFFAKLAKN